MEYILLEKEEGMPWTSYMQKENSLAVGAVEEDMLVAFAVFSERENYPEYIELTYIYVEEEWREQYVAASLLEYMESELRASGYRYVLAQARRVHDTPLPDFCTYYVPFSHDNKVPFQVFPYTAVLQIVLPCNRQDSRISSAGHFFS